MNTSGGTSNVLAKPGSPNPDRTGALYNHAINPIITAQTRGGCGDRSAISSNIWTSPDKRIVIHNGDCMAAMAGMRNKAFDLAIVDPPYGIGLSKKSAWWDSNAGKAGKTKFIPKQWDNNIPDIKYFEELYRVSQDQIIFGGNYFSGMLKPSRGWIVWDKKQPDGCDFAMAELISSSFDSNIKIFEYFPSHVNQGSRVHVCQKPVTLYKWILQRYAQPGQTILDTHAGSCSLAIACIDLGFKLTAYEIDADYFNAAIARIEKHLSQPKLPCCDPNTMNQGRLI